MGIGWTDGRLWFAMLFLAVLAAAKMKLISIAFSGKLRAILFVISTALFALASFVILSMFAAATFAFLSAYHIYDAPKSVQVPGLALIAVLAIASTYLLCDRVRRDYRETSEELRRSGREISEA